MNDDARRRAFSWGDPVAMAAARRGRDGLEFFRALAAGDMPQPPLYQALGFRIAGADPGTTRFSGEIGEYLYNSFGIVHGGYAATLIDSAAGSAVQTRLPQGTATATIRLRVEFLRPITAATGAVSCVSRVVAIGEHVAFSEAAVTDAAGRELARGRGSFVVSRGEGKTAKPAAVEKPAPAMRPEAGRRETEWADPGALIDAYGRLSGLDFIEGQRRGTVPAAGIGATLGFGPIDVSPGRAVYGCVPESWHYNPMGAVHGGLAAILIDSAGGAAVHSTFPPGRGSSAVVLTVDYLRPILRATGALRCIGTVVRAGRRIGIADATLEDGGGQMLARGSVTYLAAAA
jgi:uncharacterized protein (TIGR00369 family)